MGYDALMAAYIDLRQRYVALEAENARLRDQSRRKSHAAYMKESRKRQRGPPTPEDLTALSKATVKRRVKMTYFYEHGIEHLHAVYNRQARNYKMGEIERQHRLLKWNYLQCLLEARRSPPADAQEYLFAADEEDPTYYYEEEDADDH
ncbi:hypothetical protein DdX_01349 [Ditylenchus destructor]|uniref:Uncharacterized protein n=1 Tax=Ditylenchus destructor TaxID=166010 RepID=A0AAD4NME6_9BILA|nr:hypothetical protein DdX_01349 [Ditylenchus destructor]